MVHCISYETVTLQAQLCRSLKQTLELASQRLSRPAESLKLFYLSSNGSETEIESDSDLLSLRYMSKALFYSFKVLISKTKAEIQSQVTESVISDYLNNAYEQIAQEETRSEIKKATSDYLEQLYQQIQEKENKLAAKRLEEEEVSLYLTKINSFIVANQTVPNIFRKESRSKKVRFSLDKHAPQTKDKRRESMIEKMVGKALDQMIPFMVKELSSKIIQKLNNCQFAQLQQNPEQ